MSTKNNSTLVTYEKFYDDMILRDHLALDRTILANERTLLSYLRTVVTFMVSGLTILKLFSGTFSIIVSIILFTIGTFFGIYGGKTYLKISRKLKL